MLPLARRPSEAAGRLWRPAHESLIDTPYNFEAPCAWQPRPRSMPRVWPSPRPARGFAAPGCAPSRMAADACCRHARPILSKKPRNVTCANMSCKHRFSDLRFYLPLANEERDSGRKTSLKSLCASHFSVFLTDWTLFRESEALKSGSSREPTARGVAFRASSGKMAPSPSPSPPVVRRLRSCAAFGCAPPPAARPVIRLRRRPRAVGRDRGRLARPGAPHPRNFPRETGGNRGNSPLTGDEHFLNGTVVFMK